MADNKAVIRRFIQEAWNKGNVDAIGDLVATSYVGVDPSLPEPLRGPEGVKMHVAMYRTAFPDLIVAIEAVLAEGDRTVTQWTATGTHGGQLMGLPPTGNRVTVFGAMAARLADGKLVEGRNYWDPASLLKQLGVAPK